MAKVLSISQPYAQLVVLGAKKIETRGFITKHRGELLIHASISFPKYLRALAGSYNFRKYINDSHLNLATGAIIGKVTVVDCVASWKLKADGLLSENELAFGDYSEGRWGWILENPIAFEKPIPAKGALGLWNFDMKEEVSHA